MWYNIKLLIQNQTWKHVPAIDEREKWLKDRKSCLTVLTEILRQTSVYDGMNNVTARYM